MKIATDIQTIRNYLSTVRNNATIACVPTMGNLHDGHLELVKAAQRITDHVVVTIFVNPLQFGPNEDIDRYPRTLEDDCAKLKALQVPFLFAPNTKEIYPDIENQTQVSVPIISDDLCGIYRPHFFYGVTTVVAKLFNIIQPDYAFFGEKDFQQLHIIKKMVADLAFPIKIHSIPTVREKDGLAMSSRNQYLLENERLIATELYKSLKDVANGLVAGNNHDELITTAKAALSDKFKVDYIAIRNRSTLLPPSPKDKELIILTAAWLGKARLIDNLLIDL